MNDEAKALLDKINTRISADFEEAEYEERIDRIINKRISLSSLMVYRWVRFLFAKKFFRSPAQIVDELVNNPPEPIKDIVEGWRACTDEKKRENFFFMARIRIIRYYCLHNEYNPYLPIHNRVYADMIANEIVKVVDRKFFPTNIDKN